MNETISIPTTPDASANQPSAPVKFGFRRIMVPTNFSSLSENAVDYAVELAQRLGVHLSLLHVTPKPWYTGWKHLLFGSDAEKNSSSMHHVRF